MTPELLLLLTARFARIAALFHSIDVPLQAEVAGYQADVLASGSLALVHSHIKPKSDFVGSTTATKMCTAYLYRQILEFTGPIRDLLIPGVVDLASFADYYNTGAGGAYRCLLDEGFAALYLSVTRIALSPTSVCAPTVSNMGQRSVGGSLAPGTALDAACYAGTPRPVAAVSSSAFTNSRAASAGLVTIIGTARDAKGVVVQGREFTAKVTGDGMQPLEPETPGDLLLSVDAITLPPNMSAGTIIVQGLRPEGR